MQIKTTSIYHLIDTSHRHHLIDTVRMAIIKKTTNNISTGEVVEKKASYIPGWNVH